MSSKTPGAALRSTTNPFDLVDAELDETTFDEHLTNETMVAFRKAMKKDSTTKLRAFGELTRITNAPDSAEEVASPGFAKHFLKVFSKCSLDPERRVREAAFSLLSNICGSPSTKRCLHHIITDLAFYWVGAWFDPARVVAGAAKRSFDACFKGERVTRLAELVQKKTRRLVGETIGYRAEEARQAALADAEVAGSAQLVFALHITRAISAEVFLARLLGESDYKVIMEVLDKNPGPMINAALYNYALTVKLPEGHAGSVFSVALKDVQNAELVLDLLRCEWYLDLEINRDHLYEYVRLVVSNCAKPVYLKLRKFLEVQSDSAKNHLVISCFRPSTLDTTKLAMIVEDVFTLCQEDRLRRIVFDKLVISRPSPWNSLDVLVALELLSRAFGGEFVDQELGLAEEKSVPILVYESKRRRDVDTLCGQLASLRLDARDLQLVLTEYASNKDITDALFGDFVRALNSGQLTRFIDYFGVERLLCDDAADKTPILRHLMQNGGAGSPWDLALSLAGPDESSQLVAKMVGVCEYSDRLFGAIEEADLTGVEFDDICSSWLRSERFAALLIDSGHPKLIPPRTAAKLSAERQLSFVRQVDELDDFISAGEFVGFCLNICRSKSGWKRHYYLDMEEDNSDQIVDSSVFKVLLEKNAIPELSIYAVVYSWWCEDKFGINMDEYTQSLIPKCSQSRTQRLSAEHGGYFSRLFECIGQADTFEVSRRDHSIATCRMAIDKVDLTNVSDIELRASIMTPLVLKVPREAIEGTISRLDAIGVELGFALLSKIDDRELIGRHRERIVNTVSEHGLIAVDFLLMYPEYLAEGTKTELIERFSNGVASELECRLVRVIAPFHLDRLRPPIIVGNLLGERHESRAARFIFNLLHDDLIQRLQCRLSDGDGREERIYEVMPRELFCPESLDLFEVLVGIAEASKEVPVVLSTIIQYVEIDARLVGHIASVLGWNASTPVDLTRLEFTGIDWDDMSLPDHVLAANVLFRSFRIFPTVMRNALPGNRNLEKHFSEYIAPVIIQRELDKCRRYIRGAESKTSNLKLRVLSSSTQCSIAAEYVFEDTVLSVHLTVPSSYPYAGLLIDTTTGRRGISESKWKQALLSATPMLSFTTDIMEGLRAWSSNLDKQLAGIEPCSICYCVIHPSDRTLPNSQCRTCQHKFHAACLYKWFRTGGQATCPLCRSLF